MREKLSGPWPLPVAGAGAVLVAGATTDAGRAWGRAVASIGADNGEGGGFAALSDEGCWWVKWV
jgi:hypothetical protein